MPDGGGGRGISIIRSASTSTSTPHDAAVPTVERFVEVARHVETQSARDSLGTSMSFSTRDCSVQRRNQKLVEEAPLPSWAWRARTTLVNALPRALSSTWTTWVGTVSSCGSRTATSKFLRGFNRLQVEHPVSEEVTRIDLVREQIVLRRAWSSRRPRPRGHSEFRATRRTLEGSDAHGRLMKCIGRWGRAFVWNSVLIRATQRPSTLTIAKIIRRVRTASRRGPVAARAGRVLRQGVATPARHQDIINDPDFCGVGAL